MENYPIAIVGLGCRFPQAQDADAFWRNLAAGHTAFGPIPPERWHHELFYSANGRDTDKAWVGQGSFIEDFQEFAALHYGIAPRRLEVMDPQQRLLIEATRWAIQDAGYEKRSFLKKRTGVFVGVSIAEFQELTQARISAMRLAAGDFGAAPGSEALRKALLELVANVPPMRAFSLSGSLTALAAASVSQTFDLGGPAYTLDSACASACVAINDAVIQLRAGLIDCAIAGGAYLNLSPANLVAFTKIGAISPSGVCRPFDHRADGFVQSDGVGMVFLKRLDDALRSNDRIHAVILGSACNNDGRGEGPMTPRVEGQIAVLEAAYANAGVSPASVAYFEAHGTATTIGDPTEIEALGTTLSRAGVDAPAYIGSVKGNIGHAMSAAGIAGLAKALKVLEHRAVPPQPNYERPHPALHLEDHPLRISKSLVELVPRSGEPLRVALSSFGFGGTNAHLVLEEPPLRPRPARLSRPIVDEPMLNHEGHTVVMDRDPPAPEAILLSAPTPRLLARFAAELIAHLEGPGKQVSLADLAYTLNARRSWERWRAVLGARSLTDLLSNLQALHNGLASNPVASVALTPNVLLFDSGDPEAPAPKVAFLFPGQGAQKVGLLADVRERFPVFRDALARYESAVGRALPQSLTDYLYPDVLSATDSEREAFEEALKATEVCQPAMAALGLAMAELLAQCGVRPEISLGHSLGEFAALAAGGVLDPAHAVRLVALRGSAMRALWLDDPGTMAAVMGDAISVRRELAGLSEVWVANVNHPRQVSISGTTKGVAVATQHLQHKGLEVKPLQVSHAFHSPLLEGVSDNVAVLLDAIQIKAPSSQVASCIDSRPYDRDLARTKDILIRHATAPVDFVRGLEQVSEAGAKILVQVGAGSILTAFARATLGTDGYVFVSLSPLDNDRGYELIRGLCVLAANRVAVDFEALYRSEDRRVVTLPETPLEREVYWPIKDQPQPLPELTAPLPAPGTMRLVDYASSSVPTSISVAPAAPVAAASDALLQLFARQAELMRAQAEVLATQNRLILGEKADLNTVALENNLKAVMAMSPATELAPAPAPVAAPVVASVSEPAIASVSVSDIHERVFEIVAKVSAFPRTQLKPEQRLIDELGFDSLMLTDLGGALDAAYPRLGGLPASLFSPKTTLGDIAEAVVGRLGNNEAPTPKAPVDRYAVLLKQKSRANVGEHDVTGETWLVTEDGSTLASEISAALKVRGARLIRVRFIGDAVAAPSRLAFGTLNLWPESWAEGLPKALADANIAPKGLIHAASLSAEGFSNPIPLLHGLIARLEPQRIATVTALGGHLGLEPSPTALKNVAQSTLGGYTKALARERPEALVKNLDIDPTVVAAENAAWIVEELLGGENMVEVGFDGQRWLPELAPLAPAPAERPLTPNDVLLITGGAGELGRIMARRFALKRPKAIILCGRSAKNAAIETLLAELGRHTRAFYLAVDITQTNALQRSLEPLVQELGSVSVAIHAAGLIEDAVAPKKSPDSVKRVMEPKIRGLEALLQTLPNLSDLLLFSSWAGRFGNAGQTDYAAANEFLDRFAISGRGPRIVSFILPPWSSSSMVRSIPEALRRSLEADGVTFLSDEEGATLIEATFTEGRRGAVVLGRDLPARMFRLELTESFSLARHPYLSDHQLKGRPVVPLASATDLIAWAFGEMAAPVPLVIEKLELLRGLMGEDLATLSLKGQKRGHASAQVELRTAEGLAYRAQLQATSAEVPSVHLDGAVRALPFSLDAYYAEKTFHGPRMRGIERIDQLTQTGISGTLFASDFVAWTKNSHRGGWVIDPLALDGAFQLAGYWLHAVHGRAGFPVGFEKLVLQRPLVPGQLVGTVRLGEVTDAQFVGDLWIHDPKGVPYLYIQGIRGRFAEVRAAVEVPAESWDVAQFPEVEALEQRFQMAELMGLRNPYFHVHAGTARDTSIVDGVEMLNFSSYNYLGFSGHPEVVRAAQEAIDRYGTSVSASRVASGERLLHQQLEAQISAHVGVDDAIVMVSGHATNVTTIGHLMDRQDVIFHDSLIHDSILQGIHLSGATRRPYPHGDLEALERALSQVRKSYRRALIVAEGIYSMDGDICNLPRLIELKERYRSLLMIDEAHSIGVLGPQGRGVAHHFSGVNPKSVDIWMGTLSKSFASCGGYIAGSSKLVRFLKYTAPGFVYSAGITPPNAAAALKSLELMQAQPEVVERLRQRSRYFLEQVQAKGIDTGIAEGVAVIPAIIGNSLDCMKLSEALSQRRINVQPIVYPAVEDNAARLRFFISALHSEEQLRYTADVLAEELEKIRAANRAETQASL